MITMRMVDRSELNLEIEREARGDSFRNAFVFPSRGGEIERKESRFVFSSFLPSSCYQHGWKGREKSSFCFFLSFFLRTLELCKEFLFIPHCKMTLKGQKSLFVCPS